MFRITKTLKRQATRAMFSACMLGVVGTGCDLAVENLNDPDRFRALAEPSDMQTLVAGSWSHAWGGISTAWALWTWAAMGPQVSATTYYSAVEFGNEPRQPINNNVVLGDVPYGTYGVRYTWSRLMEIASNARDGLLQINEGAEIIEDGVNHTPRLEAFAKFLQGVSYGYLALSYDQVVVIDETIEVDEGDAVALGVERLLPWEVAFEASLDALDRAIEIAETNDFVFPTFGELWFGPEEVDNEKFIQICNQLAARFMIMAARHPEERKDVDWNRVLAYLDNSIPERYGPVLDDTGFGSSTFLTYSQSRTSVISTRWAQRVIGPADQSGAYQDWFAAALNDRDAFDIDTPDRRITGPEPTDHGSYTTYRDVMPWTADRGAYFFQNYIWGRHRMEVGLGGQLTSSGFNTGSQNWMNPDEANLYRAEALMHQGDYQGAADLINITRTRDQTIWDGTVHPGLPAVTVDGVPEVNGECVPRRDDGTCGDLMDALRYERTIEISMLDPYVGYWDMRGFGMLVDDTPTSVPVPGDELETLGLLPPYTLGGPNDPTAATYGPVNMSFFD